MAREGSFGERRQFWPMEGREVDLAREGYSSFVFKEALESSRKTIQKARNMIKKR